MHGRSLVNMGGRKCLSIGSELALSLLYYLQGVVQGLSCLLLSRPLCIEDIINLDTVLLWVCYIAVLHLLGGFSKFRTDIAVILSPNLPQPGGDDGKEERWEARHSGEDQLSK